MAKVLSEKKTTKDLILEKAFSFYDRPHYNNFSMSDLAKRAGITKPAIYRHFSSKSELLKEMQDYFFKSLSEHLLEDSSNLHDGVYSCSDLRSAVIFFAENPQFINYFICQLCENFRFEETIVKELVQRGCRNFPQKDSSGFNETKIKVHAFYCGMTFLFFLKYRHISVKKQEKVCMPEEFAEKLIKFVAGGFKGSVSENSSLFPAKIDEKRRLELDRICHLKKEDFPEENKIFLALSSVIRKNQIGGVTIEKIADELNMSKSGLYFYFANKNEMISTLIDRELDLMEVICHENSTEARNFSEVIYIFFRSVLEFFMVRPSVIPVYGWLLQTKTEAEFFGKLETPRFDFLSERFKDAFGEIDLGMKVDSHVFLFYLGMLPVAMMGFNERKNYTNDEIFTIFSAIFDFIEYGVADFSV